MKNFFTLALVALWSCTASISRQFRVTETQRLEVRAEPFNLTNSFRAGIPVTNIGSNQLGRILSAQPARQMQFAMKYSF